MKIPRFHIAFPVHDLDLARDFYINLLGCDVGRHSEEWIDFDFYGHQIVAHLSPEDCVVPKQNEVDGDQVPSRHFGVILPWDKWRELCAMLQRERINFFIEPRIRFKNSSGEQGTFFINDPSGNILEFKAFKNENQIFKVFN